MKMEYGTCPCGGTYENRWVEVRMTIGGKPMLMQDVSQGACPVCGSRVYKTEVLEIIESLMKSSPPVESSEPATPA